MRPSRSQLTPTSASWSSLTDLLPYLLEFRARIAIALVCLVAAKLASVGLPFVLKDIVDQLDTKTSQTALKFNFFDVEMKPPVTAQLPPRWQLECQ